jgi:hypothetical protein
MQLTRSRKEFNEQIQYYKRYNRIYQMLHHKLAKIIGEMYNVENDYKWDRYLWNGRELANELEALCLKHPHKIGALFGENPANFARRWPKVHPRLNIRIYERGWYWEKTEDPNVWVAQNSPYFALFDTEYADIYHDGMQIYCSEMALNTRTGGWARKGHYWQHNGTKCCWEQKKIRKDTPKQRIQIKTPMADNMDRSLHLRYEVY